MRKNNYSADDIVVMGQASGYDIKYNMVNELLRQEGFAPLFRRSIKEREQLNNPIEAPRSRALSNIREEFSSNSIGIMVFLPFIRKYGIDELIQRSAYPQTSEIDRLSSILSFVSLKLSSIKKIPQGRSVVHGQGQWFICRIKRFA